MATHARKRRRSDVPVLAVDPMADSFLQCPLATLPSVCMGTIAKYLDFCDWFSVTQAFTHTVSTTHGSFVTKACSDWNEIGTYSVQLMAPRYITKSVAQQILELLRTHPRIKWTLLAIDTRVPRYYASATESYGLDWLIRDTALVGRHCDLKLWQQPHSAFTCPLMPPHSHHKELMIDGWSFLRKLNLNRGVSKSVYISQCRNLECIESNGTVNLSFFAVVDCNRLHTVTADIWENAIEVEISRCNALKSVSLPKCQKLFYSVATPKLSYLPLAKNATTLHLSLTRMLAHEPLLCTRHLCPAATRIDLTGGACIIGATVLSARVAFVEKAIFESPTTLASLELIYPDPRTFDYKQLFKMTSLKKLVLHQSCDTMQDVAMVLSILGHVFDIEDCEVSLMSSSLKFEYQNRKHKNGFILHTSQTVWSGTRLSRAHLNNLLYHFKNTFT